MEGRPQSPQPHVSQSPRRFRRRGSEAAGCLPSGLPVRLLGGSLQLPHRRMRHRGERTPAPSCCLHYVEGSNTSVVQLTRGLASPAMRVSGVDMKRRRAQPAQRPTGDVCDAHPIQTAPVARFVHHSSTCSSCFAGTHGRPCAPCRAGQLAQRDRGRRHS
jgi:hypothetical protein